jgi:hypothetical protein
MATETYIERLLELRGLSSHGRYPPDHARSPILISWELASSEQAAVGHRYPSWS